jgi:hypothetical protein
MDLTAEWDNMSDSEEDEPMAHTTMEPIAHTTMVELRSDEI